MADSQIPDALTPAVIAFGANLGDRGETIMGAARALSSASEIHNFRIASLHRSVAITLSGPDPDAPEYLNTVALLDTSLEAATLLTLLHQIEADFGRERSGARWSARTLDLDLISFGAQISELPELLLPHPRAHERDFVLAPWLELDPDAELFPHGKIKVLLTKLSGVEDETH